MIPQMRCITAANVPNTNANLFVCICINLMSYFNNIYYTTYQNICYNHYMDKPSHFSRVISVLRNRTLHEVVVIVLGVGAIVGYGEYRRYDVVQDLRGVDQRLTIEKEGLEQRISETESQLELVREETSKIIALLQSELQSEQTKSATFAQEISKIAGTVGTLDKLSKTDEEL